MSSDPRPPAGRHVLGIPVVAGLVLIAIAATWAITARYAGRRPPAEPAAGRRTGADSTPPMAGMARSGGASVQLTADDIRNFGVLFGSVAERPLVGEVRAAGTVTFDERRLAQVTARFGGYVEQLYGNATGQPVRRGDPLAAIYSPELVAAEQELLLARRLDRTVGSGGVPRVPDTGSSLVAAAKRRLELWGIAEGDINRILETGAIRRTLPLNAPEPGIILEKHVVEGQAVQPGMALFTIADLSRVWVDVALREPDAARARAGSPAAIALAAFPGRSLAGRVDYIYPTLDSTTRTVRARIVVPNPSGLLKPGMYAIVTLETPERRALTVPTSAVMNTGARTLVFMDAGNGRLVPTEIVTGETAGPYTEVLSGLAPGQRVVTSAQYLLDSESNLAEVMKRMIGQGTGSPGNAAGAMNGMPMPATGDSAARRGPADPQGMQGMDMPASPPGSRR